ncbi:MAG: argininosuccinate synthase [Alishewanella agri]|jgi:argininosuccinate synthase|uniref:Argininosuccinate synthase n=2 Tax=Alishewanella TaxID=111142 RepID=I9NZ26_9ALTE|nr:MULTISPECIES: argininosuccinate synthase [Alishewanella]MDD4863540.1 argininosuccinate synthase [Alishewanella agri]EIW87674.1 argininosuccinate synthase [Alishewanella agri BL06]EJI85066.1 argininosuccinate synthase [Alishewanella aestuarii B11]KRS21801.1 argininosuccinate synthase [Alishewanella sp. WH16-1]MCT8124631.1 argininosuccinate synthase [Alishewanella sp. BS5-314]
MSVKNVKKVVLAYSGGLDTSAIVPWLKDNYDCEVIAFVANVGQGDEELAGVEQKAINSGASSCYVVDLREELVNEVIFPTLKTGAVYEGQYLLGTSMARPVIARAQVKLALELGADALCHGCTGKGNDQVRFEGAFAALAPQLKVIAPWREWEFNSRQSLLNYLAEKKIPTTASATKIYSRDANLWHISHEGGEIENPWNEPSDQIWMWTKSPEQAPDKAEYVELSFEAGELKKVNGQAMNGVAAIELLNAVGSEHGVGRIDIVENRLVGMKSRGCYETPGGTIILAALKGLEALVYDRTSLKYREEVGLEFAQLVYDGRWFTPLKDALLAAATSLAAQLTGDVVVKLYKGNVTVAKRRSPNSLYSEAFATFEGDEVYNQKDAEGFIRLYSLASRIRALHAKKD